MVPGFSRTFFVFVELVDQASVAQLFKLGIVGFVIGLVVFPRTQETDVLLKVMVNLLEPIDAIDDREEPPRPCEDFGIAILKKDTVESVDERLHGLFGLNVLFVTPTHQRLGGTPDFAFHLALCGFRDVDDMGMTLES